MAGPSDTQAWPWMTPGRSPSCCPVVTSMPTLPFWTATGRFIAVGFPICSTSFPCQTFWLLSLYCLFCGFALL